MFLATPQQTDEARKLFDEDVEELGYVMNVSRLWAYQPAWFVALFDLVRQVAAGDRLSLRERAILVTACASTLGDSYCSLVWGGRLAGASDADTAAGVLRGHDGGLSEAEQAMADWARKVSRDPNATTAADVQALR